MLSREKIEEALTKWNKSWDDHDLNGVMELFHEDVYFENWTGGWAQGKDALYKSWKPWFDNHGGFRFNEEDTFIDVANQKVLYQWQLDWPSNEKGYEGKKELRRGLDILHFKEGKIIRKLTYCKTTIEIEGKRTRLLAERG